MGNDRLNYGVNWTGVLLGGVVAGLILVGFGILDVTVSERDWIPWLENLSRAPLPFTTAFQGAGSRIPLPFLPLAASISAVGVVVETVIGIWSLWLYAAISLRYGQGRKTAVAGGLAAWLMIAVVTFSFASMAGTAIGSIFSGLGFYLVTILVATTVGSLLYQDAAWMGQPEMEVPAPRIQVSRQAPPELAPEMKSAAPTPPPARLTARPDPPASAPAAVSPPAAPIPGAKPIEPPEAAPAPPPAPAASPPEVKSPEPPVPVPTPEAPPPIPPAPQVSPTVPAAEKTVSYADNIPAVEEPASPASPPAAPKPPAAEPVPATTLSYAESPAPAEVKASPAPPPAAPRPPVAEPVPATTLSYAESPAPAEVKASPGTPPAVPMTPSSAEPASPPPIDTQHQELHETVVALELNIEVAVREVLRIFGQQPLSVDEIVQHLTAVRWDFGELHPRVATTEALKNLVAQSGAKEEDGKYVFSRA